MKTTIHKTAIDVLTIIGFPMTVKEIFDYIILNDLYQFRAENPFDVLNKVIRKHCEGIDFPSAKKQKYFQLTSDRKYWLVNTPVPGLSKKEEKEGEKRKIINQEFHQVISDIETNHQKHIHFFKQQIINRLKEMPPQSFEEFSKKLLTAYGFKKMVVTNYVKDGGIDGHGQLKVGITHLNVAFQSKRWKIIL